MDIGAQLRTAREAKGLSIDRLSERTRVPARTLAAIDRNDRSALPPHPFDRGFVRTYAEEVGLDPERLVRDFFAQFPTQVLPISLPVAGDDGGSPWQAPSRWMGMAGAVAILLIVVTAAVVLGRRGERAAEPNTVGTTGAVAATPTGTGSALPQPTSPPGATGAAPAAPPVTSSAITVVLSMSRPCWVAATVDGRRTIYRILQAGERETIVAARDVQLRLGDAGAVSWTINGRDAGVPGANGAIRDVHVTPENAATTR